MNAVAKVEVNYSSLHSTAQGIIIYQSLRGSCEEKHNNRFPYFEAVDVSRIGTNNSFCRNNVCPSFLL
jgi:hypothetical protein